MKFDRIVGACIFLVALMAAPLQAKTPDDQLIIGMSMNNLLSLDPAGGTGLDVVAVNVNLYDTLVELDAKQPSKVLPGFAESWKIAPDGRSITFKIRTGVKSHAGNTLTAEDAAWSLQRVLKLNQALATTWKTYGFSKDNVDKHVRATDPTTLVIELPEPTDARLVLYTLGTSASGMILDRKKVMENEKAGDMGSAWLTTNAAGSGPFKLDEWRSKDVLFMSRFDEYWRGPAKMKRVVMRHMTESQSLRLMLEKGDIDLASGMSVPDIEAFKNHKEVTSQSVQRGGMYYLAVSVKDPKFQDKRVREALRYLIDYEGINKTTMPHYGFLHQRPIAAGLPATLKNPGYKPDIARAKKLLAQAGYKNGFKTTLRTLSEPPFVYIATSIQETLAKAGIDAEIITGTGNQIYGAMRDRKFEMLVGRGGGGAEPHPHSSLRALIYNPDNRDEAKLINFQGWRTNFISPEINELIEQAEVETDEKKQTAMYHKVQNIYDKEVGAIQPISQQVETVVLRRDVKNYVGHPSATTRLREVTKQR